MFLLNIGALGQNITTYSDDLEILMFGRIRVILLILVVVFAIFVRVLVTFVILVRVLMISGRILVVW